MNTRTTNGTGGGVFTSNITSLLLSTTYYVRAYATNSAGTTYGNQQQFTTSSIAGCGIQNLSVTKVNGKWNFTFNLNPSCSTYTVECCRYSNTNPLIPPTLGQRPAQCGIRNSMNGYVPSTSEKTQGFIQREMSPPPSNLNTWYSLKVTCKSANCTTNNVTWSQFFYTTP